jgi:hypothetical protein
MFLHVATQSYLELEFKIGKSRPQSMRALFTQYGI